MNATNSTNSTLPPSLSLVSNNKNLIITALVVGGLIVGTIIALALCCMALRRRTSDEEKKLRQESRKLAHAAHLAQLEVEQQKDNDDREKKERRKEEKIARGDALSKVAAYGSHLDIAMTAHNREAHLGVDDDFDDTKEGNVDFEMLQMTEVTAVAEVEQPEPPEARGFWANPSPLKRYAVVPQLTVCQRIVFPKTEEEQNSVNTRVGFLHLVTKAREAEEAQRLETKRAEEFSDLKARRIEVRKEDEMRAIIDAARSTSDWQGLSQVALSRSELGSQKSARFASHSVEEFLGK